MGGGGRGWGSKKKEVGGGVGEGGWGEWGK